MTGYYVAFLPPGEDFPLRDYDDSHRCAQRVYDLGLSRVQVFWKRGDGQIVETSLYVYPADTRPRGDRQV